MKRFFCLLWLTAITLAADPLLAGEQSLYFNIGLGWADPAYEDEMEAILSELEDLPDMDHMSIAVDLALYFPMGSSGMLGPALTGIGDRFEQNGVEMQINNYLFGISFRQYVSGERGKGLYIRGDAGLARVVTQATDQDDFVSDVGTGVLLGGGYSFEIADGRWCTVNADYAYKKVEGDKVGGLSIGGALMF